MKKIIIATLAVMPVLASAQSLDNVETLLRGFGDLVRIAIPIVFGIAILAFFWGLVKFILAQANEEKKADAKKIMIWSVVAMFIMAAIWGIVQFIGTALGIQPGTGTPNVPTVPGL